MAPLSRAEPGCLRYDAYRGPRRPRQVLRLRAVRRRGSVRSAPRQPAFPGDRRPGDCCRGSPRWSGSRSSRSPDVTQSSHRDGDARRALPRGADAAPADRRDRPADPDDPGRVRHVARGRRAAEHDPRPLHGPVRAGRRVPRGQDRDAARDDDRSRADRGLRHPPGDDAVGVARRPPHLARRDRDGARQRAGADLRQGALRGPAGRRARASTRPGSRSARPARRRSPCRSPAGSTAGAAP